MMIDLQQIILAPLQLEFMQRAILAVMLFGIVSGVMGAFVVTRGMAFLGDALSHSILPGVAVAFINGGRGQVLGGALVTAVIAALSIGFLTRRARLREDTAIGIVFTGMLALGIAIISSSRAFATDLTHILFGDVLAVGGGDLFLIALVGCAILLAVLLFYKEFLVISFDAVLADTLRLPAETLRMALLILLALTIVIGVQALGVTLLSAMLITPAATARLYARRLHYLMLLSAVISSVCALVGMYVAWYAQLPPSAAIVLTMTIVFLLSFFFAPSRGYLWSLIGRSAIRH